MHTHRSKEQLATAKAKQVRALDLRDTIEREILAKNIKASVGQVKRLLTWDRLGVWVGSARDFRRGK